MQQQRSKPTFKDVCKSHKLNVGDLIGPIKLYQTTINQMLNSKPVLPAYANRVLSTLSEHVEQHYSLDNVDVVLINVEVQHG